MVVYHVLDRDGKPTNETSLRQSREKTIVVAILRSHEKTLRMETIR